MVILKNPIEEYNNKLKVSNENMVFGINKTLDYYGEEKKLQGNETKIDSKIIPPKASSENLWILPFALVGGVLISKCV